MLIGGDFNAHLGKENGYQYSFHITTNRNGNMLINFIRENNLLCLNTHFQKISGLWIHSSPNNFKSQIDFIIINKNGKTVQKNCRAYNSFISLASEHRIISAKILLCLRANKKKLCNNKPYDWTKMKQYINIRNKFVTEVKDRFKTLQEFKPTDVSANTRYNYFEIACKEAAENIIPL